MDEISAAVRVRYVETDQMGVVHHSVYFHWMEVGRTEYMRMKGLPYSRMEEMGIRMPLIEARAEYLSPARYDDELEVRTRLGGATPVTFVFDYEIVRKRDMKVIARGTTRHVAADGSNRPRRVPKDVFDLIGGNIVKQG